MQQSKRKYKADKAKRRSQKYIEKLLSHNITPNYSRAVKNSEKKKIEKGIETSYLVLQGIIRKRTINTKEFWFTRYHICTWKKHRQWTKVKDCNDQSHIIVFGVSRIVSIKDNKHNLKCFTQSLKVYCQPFCNPKNVIKQWAYQCKWLYL